MTAAEEVPSSATQVVAAYLTERIGLSVTGARRTHLLRQIADAMTRVSVTSGGWYCARLDRDEDEFDDLVNRVTVGESYFFREPGQLEVLRSTILPERRSVRGAGLQLWSAGCSIGQEAYTLAMVLEEEGLAASAHILATDIAREALGMAAAGVYGSWSLRAVTDRQREAYFHRVTMGYRVDERFARSITFRPLNLLDPTKGAPGDIDVILCRNVLIYFAPEAVARVARHLAGALAPGGWLVTGSSDPPLEGVAELEPTATAAGLVYRRSSATPRDGAAARGAVVGTVAVRGHPPAVVPRTVVPRTVVSPAVVARPIRPVTPSPATDDGTGDEAVRVIRSLGGAGDLAGALDVAAGAIVRLPLHAELRFLQAVVLLETGRATDAATSARAALYLDPGLVMAHLALARAQVALGLQEAARRSLRNADALLRALPGDAPVPMSDGEPAGRLVAMAAAHDRALVGARHRGGGNNP